jgi:hypothetical protein
LNFEAAGITGSVAMFAVKWAGIACLSWSGAALNAEECAGLGDVDASGFVDLSDFALLGGCLAGEDVFAPPAGCAAISFVRGDIDSDNDVDMRDYVRFLATFGEAYFDYGVSRENEEAELLAMAMTGQLRAPDEEYERVLSDLQLIRAAFPSLAGVIDDPDFVPHELIVDLINGQSLEPYKALNSFYLLEQEEVLFGTTLLLTFCGNLNAPVLAAEYSNLAAVNYAEPNGFFGHDDRIEVTSPGDTYHYSIDDGFHDCFDGCDCHRLWEIEVDINGTVGLISYMEQGLPWCEF